MRKNEQNFIRKIKDQKEKIEKLFKKKVKKKFSATLKLVSH